MLYKKNLSGIKEDNLSERDSKNIFIKIFIKNKEVYKFCKEDAKRIYFILKILFSLKKKSYQI
ncbi:plasmid partition family protein (plasmid) [Borreliella turdi]|uniref:plasmid partition family protein n=1 Tax=Borreliella turdi TaxID=57863 RepID=UPI003AF02A3D